MKLNLYKQFASNWTFFNNIFKNFKYPDWKGMVPRIYVKHSNKNTLVWLKLALDLKTE